MEQKTNFDNFSLSGEVITNKDLAKATVDATVHFPVEHPKITGAVIGAIGITLNQTEIGHALGNGQSAPNPDIEYALALGKTGLAWGLGAMALEWVDGKLTRSTAIKTSKGIGISHEGSSVGEMFGNFFAGAFTGIGIKEFNMQLNAGNIQGAIDVGIGALAVVGAQIVYQTKGLPGRVAREMAISKAERAESKK